MHSAIRVYDPTGKTNFDKTFSHGGQAAGAMPTQEFVKAYPPSEEIRAYHLNISQQEAGSLLKILAGRFPGGMDVERYNGAFWNCAQAAQTAISGASPWYSPRGILLTQTPTLRTVETIFNLRLYGYIDAPPRHIP
jgi:hypothetical protein